MLLVGRHEEHPACKKLEWWGTGMVICLQQDANLVGRHEGHPACKKLEWWGTGMVICLERDANLHTAQLMPLPLTVSCFSKIQIGFTFLVLAHPGSPAKRAVKRVCVCVCALCTTVVHNTVQSSSNNIPLLPPENHHSSDAV